MPKNRINTAFLYLLGFTILAISGSIPVAGILKPQCLLGFFFFV